MYNDNENNNYPGRAQVDLNTDNDVNYTEGEYSDHTYERQHAGTQNSGYGMGGGSGASGYGMGGSGASGYGTGGGPGMTGGGSGAGGAGGGYPDGPGGYGPDGPQHHRRGRLKARHVAGIAAAAILFGCVAGGTMAGVNVLTDRMIPKTAEASQVTQAQAQVPTIGGQTAAHATATASTGNDVSNIVAEALPSVVAINNKMVYTRDDWLFGQQQYEATDSGSGIIVGQNDTELLIMTNNHVIENSDQLSVTFADNTSVNAAVKGTDSDSDLAVIAVKLSDIPEATRGKIKPATLGDSNQLKLGQGVVAIGNALGQGQSVTVGYVSALNKHIKVGGTDRTVLQVDAAINPGNSGGALLNMNGEVIGINVAKYADTEVEGIGYAIPISYAKNIIQNLMTQTTKVKVADNEQGYLGIQLQNIDSDMSQAYGMPQGIYIYKIVPGGPASKSDLKERDIITKVDGENVSSGEELQKMMTYYKGGTPVTLTIQRLENGSYVAHDVKVTLGFKKDSQPAKQPVHQGPENSKN